MPACFGLLAYTLEMLSVQGMEESSVSLKAWTTHYVSMQLWNVRPATYALGAGYQTGMQTEHPSPAAVVKGELKGPSTSYPLFLP